MNNNVSHSATIPALEEAQNLLSTKRNQIFIEDDSFLANPYLLLGNVIEIRKNGQLKCPKQFNSTTAFPEFSILSLQGFELDETSKLSQPIKRKSLLVDMKLSAKINFLSYLQTELDHNSIFNVMVFDQAAGRINTHSPTWSTAVGNWKTQNQHLLEDEDICYLLAVTGMVQKNVIRKKYRKFEVGAKGGGWGINVNGKLHTSNEDYSLDFRFGLSVGVISRPRVQVRGLEKANSNALLDEPDNYELDLFGKIPMIQRK